ncbi:MAG: hypothetical protein R3E39_09320 [Anaerolineae bacterium]
MEDRPQESDWLDDDDERDLPYWTPQRIIFTLVIIITLIAFLAYVFAPLLTAIFTPPPPAPIPLPLDRV